MNSAVNHGQHASLSILSTTHSIVRGTEVAWKFKRSVSELTKLDTSVQSTKTGKWVRPYLQLAQDQYGNILGCSISIEDDDAEFPHRFPVKLNRKSK